MVGENPLGNLSEAVCFVFCVVLYTRTVAVSTYATSSYVLKKNKKQSAARDRGFRRNSSLQADYDTSTTRTINGFYVSVVCMCVYVCARASSDHSPSVD